MPNRLDLSIARLSRTTNDVLRQSTAVKLHTANTSAAALTHLTRNANPTKIRHKTTISILLLRQYGAPVAGYITMPHNVYTIVHSTTLLATSSPVRWQISSSPAVHDGVT